MSQRFARVKISAWLRARPQPRLPTEAHWDSHIWKTSSHRRQEKKFLQKGRVWVEVWGQRPEQLDAEREFTLTQQRGLGSYPIVAKWRYFECRNTVWASPLSGDGRRTRDRSSQPSVRRRQPPLHYLKLCPQAPGFGPRDMLFLWEWEEVEEKLRVLMMVFSLDLGFTAGL